MKILQGDLLALALEGRFDVIIHGCNCFCSMGGGIARQIRREFPEAYEADLQTQEGLRDKLGNYSKAEIHRGKVHFTIINGYTQYNYFGKSLLVDYQALEKLFKRIKQDFSGKRIGYPKIGAGLAGGDWERIHSIINQELQGEDHCLVLYK